MIINEHTVYTNSLYIKDIHIMHLTALHLAVFGYFHLEFCFHFYLLICEFTLTPADVIFKLLQEIIT